MYDPPSSDVSVPTPRRKRTVLWASIGIVTAVAAFVFIVATDDRLDPAAEAFFYGSEPGPAESERVEFAIIGLSAPLGVSDIHAYGLDLVRRARVESVRTGALAELPRPDTEIGFIGESDALRCWFLALEAEDKEPCVTREEVTRMLEDNSMMLDRYRRLLAYRSSGFDIWGRTGSRIKDLQRLYLTKAVLLSQEGATSDALRLWSEELEFLRAHSSQPNDLINRLMIGFHIKRNLGLLESLLLRQPALTMSDIDIIEASVRPLSKSDWNLAGAMRAEFSHFDYSTCFHPDAKRRGDDHCFLNATIDKSEIKPNMTVNAMYAFVKRFLDISHRPPAEIAEACERLSEYTSRLKVPNVRQELFNAAGHRILFDFFAAERACTLPLLLHKRDAALRLFSVWALAYRAKLKGLDPRVVLKAVPEQLHDPFSGEPPSWERSEGILAFPEGDGFAWRTTVPLAP